MVKKKSAAIILTSDGAGGMRQTIDHRFDDGEFPIQFEVPSDQAENWMQYLAPESLKQNLGYSTHTQHSAEENSGSITLTTSGAEQRQLTIVWERKRGESMKVRARSEGTPEFPLDLAGELFAGIKARCVAGTTDIFNLYGQLCYDGLPWRGELRLGDKIRLCPPSKQDEAALLGSRVILVYTQVEAIDWVNAHQLQNVIMRELSVFLSVVLRMKVQVAPTGHRVWTWMPGTDGKPECELRQLGYIETQTPSEATPQNPMRPVPTRAIERPDFSINAIAIGEDTEQLVPEDIVTVWQMFDALPPDKRKQFQQVGSLWQLALFVGHEYETARFAWMVAACEALKPPGPKYANNNIYHVVEALLGKPAAELLKEEWVRAQAVRSEHFHRGEFCGSEFIQDAWMSSFFDPTFDQASRALAEITPAAIIEWLRAGGNCNMSPFEPRKKRKR